MKNPLFAFSACLRHAFMTGVGYDDFSRIDETDQRRWAEYDPPETGAFATMAAILAGDRVEVNGEPPTSMILHPNVFNGRPVPEESKTLAFALSRGKDLEYMWKEIRMSIPEGSIWTHKGNEAFYRVTGLALNTITDEWDVEYVPLYKCRISKFTRQAVNHEKAFWERFAFVNDGEHYAGGAYPEIFSRMPVEKDAEE